MGEKEGRNRGRNAAGGEGGVTDSYVLVPDITTVVQIITFYMLEELAYFE